VQRLVIEPAVMWTWSLVWRRDEVRPVVLAAAEAMEVSDSLCKCLVLNEGVHCDRGIEWEAGPRGA
jgi:hypothetical protein